MLQTSCRMAEYLVVLVVLCLKASVFGSGMLQPPTRPFPIPTTIPTSHAPPWTPYSFTFTYENRSISLDDLRPHFTSALYWSTEHDCLYLLDRSCKDKCTDGKDPARARDNTRVCYCDVICLEIGDCCYDYIHRCQAGLQWKRPPADRPSPKTCTKVKGKDTHGYIMVSGCSNHRADDKTAKKCRGDGDRQTSLLSGAPVFDRARQVTYKNIYCARCNNATSVTYWSINVECRDEDFSAYWGQPHELLKAVQDNCKWRYEPSVAMGDKSEMCYPPPDVCPVWRGSGSSGLFYRRLVHDMCSMYSLPVKGSALSRPGEEIYARNPHCVMCRNITGSFECDTTQQPYDPPAALNILFDFTSQNKYDMNIKQGKTVRRSYKKDINCAPGQAYDVLKMKCEDLPTMETSATSAMPTTSEINGTGSEINGTGSNCTGTESINGTGSAINESTGSKERPENCSLLIYRNDDYAILKNESILIISERTTYPKGRYTIHGSKAVICVSKRVSARKKNLIDSHHSNKITEEKIITYIGHALSFVAEVALLFIYSMFKALRNIPGKNLMCFSASLLLYQVLFVLTGFQNIRVLCTIVAVLLHYFMLTSFAWMAVMAYDVMKTFTNKGVRSKSWSRFVKYSCVAWGVPLFFVSVCVSLDKTISAVNIGYGSYECWMANSPYRLAVVHAPVAMVIIFNFVALVSTITAIRRTQKTCQMARENGNNLPILVVKLSSVMGFTWILGLLLGVVQSNLLLYSYIVLNSLQGFIVGVLFITNKNTIKLITTRGGEPHHTSSRLKLTPMTSTKEGVDGSGVENPVLGVD